MCLLTIAQNVHPDYPFVIISNRDMWSERAAKCVAPDPPKLAALQSPDGRFPPDALLCALDGPSRGTWLAICPFSRRFSVVTNIGGRGGRGTGARYSRGLLVTDLALHGPEDPRLVRKLEDRAHFPGFNLVTGLLQPNASPPLYITNCDPDTSAASPQRAWKALAPGSVHAVGNDLLGDDAVRAEDARLRVQRLLSERGSCQTKGADELAEACAAIFSDPALPATPSWSAILAKFLLVSRRRRRQPGIALALLTAALLFLVILLGVSLIDGSPMLEHLFAAFFASLLLGSCFGFWHHCNMQAIFVHAPLPLPGKLRQKYLWTTVAQTVIILDKFQTIHYYFRDTNNKKPSHLPPWIKFSF